MIVSPATAKAIRAGRIMQTRLPRVPGRACPYRAGHDYPLRVRRGRGSTGDAESRIEVLAVSRQLAGEITFADARRGGFRTTDEWKVQWVRRYDSTYQRQRAVNDYLWSTGAVDAIMLERFEREHAFALVWNVVFKPTEGKRFLARPTRTSGDYVSHPGRAIDPIECVDTDTQERYAKATREDNERRRASFRRDLEEARTQQKATGNLSNRALRHVNNATQRRV